MRQVASTGGQLPPFVPMQRVLQPVAAANGDVLAPDGEAIAARLLGWLDT